MEADFYTDFGQGEPTVGACLRDLERSRERHILRYRNSQAGANTFAELPIWSAVEAWSFGTLSRCIERGDQGELANAVAASLGMARSGFAYRVRAFVYLRNRCAHLNRLWNHSVIDAGPTPNNVRAKAKRLVGQFDHRSIIDVLASLDDLLVRTEAAEPLIPSLIEKHDLDSLFWQGLSRPRNPIDHRA